jgi:hypothetical protein
VKIRIYATILTHSNGVPVISYDDNYTEFSSVQPDQTPGFRIRGKVTQVEATVSMAINPITFSIYNLGPDSRALFQSQVGTKIEVFAGYGNNPKQIAVGNILWSMTHKEGPDYITEIIAGDAHFALTNGTINTSFQNSVTYQQVIDTLIKALESVGISRGTIAGVPSGSYNNGIVLSGGPLDELAKVCSKLNLSCFVSANKVNILPHNSDIGAAVIALSESTGLIGIPQVRSPGVIGVVQQTNPVSPQNNLSFTHLLRPELGMFQMVKIVSKFVNGNYVLARVVHDFDSWDGPFFTECEAFLAPKTG